jgi:hypothetical protein
VRGILPRETDGPSLRAALIAVAHGLVVLNPEASASLLPAADQVPAQPTGERRESYGLQFQCNTNRPLSPPIPVDVRENARQLPVAFRIKGRWLKVVSIDEVWSIDEEWWRERPIVRMYYRVSTEDGRQITVFRDMLDGVWYWQNA